MNLRDFEYLVAVADHKHFGKAAEYCNVSQPTLSMQLKKLEEFLGAPLIERSNRKVMLTPLGEEVVARGRAMLQLSRDITTLAKGAGDPFSGEITLGAFPTLAPYLLPIVMPALNKAFPKLTVRLLEDKTDVLLNKLESGEIDCALIALPLRSPALESKILFEEDFYVAVPTHHPLAKKKTVSSGALSTYSLLLLDEGHCLREQALGVCRQIGAQESQSFRATSLETLREMVIAGSAITLMPKLARRDERGKLCYIGFENPVPSRTIALCWRRTTTRLPLMNGMAATIATVAQTALKRK